MDDATTKCWRGESPDDIATFLGAYSEQNYKVEEFRLCRCDCGSFEFSLDASDVEGVARRRCSKCGNACFICDSSEFWDDAKEIDRWQCTDCYSPDCNVAVGFAFYADKLDIKWLYVGCRCVNCGVLRCVADWKVGYSPSLHLLDTA
jgi:hypothetical protein